MVARINTPNSINRALNYNEQKVKNKQAELLHAEGFLKDAEQLNFKDKLRRFTNLIELNDRSKTNSLHISLNFDNSDRLDAEKLVNIAKEYMSGIGFAEQPYLVYQHRDAGHPHIHIVTTSIRMDGSRIDTFNIGRNQSENTRKEIEVSFGLVRAEDSKLKQAHELKPVTVQRVQYGRSETKRAISNVLDAVLKNYKYTSLPELNAVLHQYNILADRGAENSRVHQNNGLVYRILSLEGNKVGIPVKANDFYNRPTLKYLEERFLLNDAGRQSYKARVKNAIDLILLRQSKNLSVEGLIKALEKEGINTVLRQNTEGVIYGITYVDFRTKCVFNGSILGKQYSAKAIQERCEQPPSTDIPSAIQYLNNILLLHGLLAGSSTGVPDKKADAQMASANVKLQVEPYSLNTLSLGSVPDNLLQSEQTLDYIPNQLKNKGKKKKKKRNNHL